MKSNLRDKFRDFLTSEEGRVGVKAPLAVGIASGSIVLASAMQAPAWHDECPCDAGEVCIRWCDDWSFFVDDCMGDWHNVCR